tara:strand:- start:16319 stop:16726 length:408 start_codon:yes stop_codon:yes gene_type:complete
MPKLSILDRYLWSDTTLPWTEEHLQIAIVEQLRKRERLGGFTFAADMNAGRRSPKLGAKLRLAGMTSGEADMRFYLSDGRLGMIELKKAKGVLSKSQKERHALLKSLGHDVRVVKAGCPQDAVDQTLAILDEWIS